MSSLQRAKNRWSWPAIPHYTDNNRSLLTAIHDQTEELYQDTIDIRRSHQLDFAQNKSLGKLGNFVEVYRQSGENDDYYRKRIEVCTLAKFLKSTEENFIKLAAIALETSPLNLYIQISGSNVSLSVDTDIVNAATLSQADIEKCLDEGVSPLYSVTISDNTTATQQAAEITLDQPEPTITTFGP